MFIRVLLAVLLGSLTCASVVRAHDARPAYLELTETAPSRYEVVWRTPVNAGMRLPIILRFPDTMHEITTPSVTEMSGLVVERWLMDAGNDGLVDKRIEFVGLQGTITDVLVRVQALNGKDTIKLVHPSRPWVDIAKTQEVGAVASAFFVQGIEHILFGTDHLLFILGLILLTTGIWRLVQTITAFTVAHSITLALAVLGFVHVPSKPVEAVIALSIVFLAAEIVHARRGRVGLAAQIPWLVAFTFGLLHGLGFAGALSEVGLPEGHIPVALLFFNVGVEAGQLLFVAAVLSIIGIAARFRLALPRWADLAPAYVIGGIASFWMIERIAAF